MGNIAVYPGSFDPITNGHLSLIRRGLRIFERVIVAVAHNPAKKPLFEINERIQLIKDVLAADDLTKAAEVDTFQGLTVNYAEKVGANVLLKGIRATSDFENEFQQALMNRKLNRDIESVFLMTDYKWLYFGSSLIKEVTALGGDISGLVPELVGKRLKEKYGRTD